MAKRQSKSEVKSDVITLLDHVYSTAMRNRVSWDRVNQAMRCALELAIGSMFQFGLKDFKIINDAYKSSHWIGESWERWYSLAVAEGNKSAWLAFENMMGREAIIAYNVTPVRARYAHSTGTRDTERLHVGAGFQYQGFRVFVTSFNADGSLNACVYKDHAAGSDRVYGIGKPIRRFKIDRDAVIADRAERARKQQIATEALSLPKNKQTAFLKKLGDPSREGFFRIPLKKIEAAYSAVAKESGKKN